MQMKVKTKVRADESASDKIQFRNRLKGCVDFKAE
jgi:hypothetical protein